MERLKQIIKDESRVILAAQTEIEEKYLSDGLGRLKGQADALVFVVSTEEVSQVMKFADENGIAVTPRGAGTNLTGSTVPLYRGIVLDVSRMNRILELDEVNMTVTVEPGVVLEHLQKYVEERGLFYPPDPGEKEATIGGNISTNAGGMRAVKYGVTRDYVRSLEVVLADGTVTTLGSSTIKDSSGLALKHLLIGAEGTLGVITKCVLKLIPKPAFSVSALIPFENLDQGAEAALKILRSGLDVTAVEFVQREALALGEEYTGLEFPFPQAGAYIIITFDGDDETHVSSTIKKAEEIGKEAGSTGFLLLSDPVEIDRVWKVRGALVKAVEAVSEQEPMDLVLPVEHSAGYLEYLSELQGELGIRLISFGHAGDGNIHACIMREGRSEEEWEQVLHETMERMYTKAQELGGLPSGEHGIGLVKKPYFFKVTSKVNIELMKSVKSVFDRHSILNRGKVVTE